MTAKMKCVVEFEDGSTKTCDTFTKALGVAKGKVTIRPQKGGNE